jgi:hypothetical protein
MWDLTKRKRRRGFDETSSRGCAGEDSPKAEEKSSGWILRRALVLEDVGDVGDEYNYSPPADDTRITTGTRAARITQTQAGPLRAAYRVELELLVPPPIVNRAGTTPSSFRLILDSEFCGRPVRRQHQRSRPAES